MHEPPRERDPRPVARERVPVHEDDLPATVGDVKSVRRWLLVTAAWAVAATAIAVIALLAANKEDSTDRDLGARTASQVGRVQRDLNERIDELESRLQDLAPSEDLTSIDRRLRKVEQGAGKVSTSVDETTTAIEDLEGRVEALEEQADQPDPTTETTPGETP